MTAVADDDNNAVGIDSDDNKDEGSVRSYAPGDNEGDVQLYLYAPGDNEDGGRWTVVCTW